MYSLAEKSWYCESLAIMKQVLSKVPVGRVVETMASQRHEVVSLEAKLSIYITKTVTR